MKYLILVYSNPATRETWHGFSASERAEAWQAHTTLAEKLSASGELVLSQALADPSQAKRVTVREDRTITSDGPFAEVKEHLAGFYLIECDTIERAIEHASQVPEATFGLVEVRPVAELNGS